MLLSSIRLKAVEDPLTFERVSTFEFVIEQFVVSCCLSALLLLAAVGILVNSESSVCSMV
jgi:hypothetical protein